MAGLNLNHLRRLVRRWRPSKAAATTDMESLHYAQSRRAFIVNLLEMAEATSAREGDDALARQLQGLKVKLERGRRSRGGSLADPVEIRRQRDVIGAHLWRFLARGGRRRFAHFVTIVPRDWQYNVDTLLYADPMRLLAALRAQLMRCGAKGTDGFLFLSIDVAYDLRHDVYQLHVHGMAAGGMLRAVQKLKKVPRFISECHKDVRQRDLDSRESVRVPHPVRVSKGPLTRLPRPCLYWLKQQFFAYLRVDEVDLSNPDAKQPRGYATRNIPEPANTTALLWRDRWDLNQTTLMMGMRVGRNGFKLL